MVNKLSDLAGFLEDQSIPLWVKLALREHREEILRTLQDGQPYLLRGPGGEEITLDPKTVAA
jgi:hypothetical protein